MPDLTEISQILQRMGTDSAVLTAPYARYPSTPEGNFWCPSKMVSTRIPFSRTR